GMGAVAPGRLVAPRGDADGETGHIGRIYHLGRFDRISGGEPRDRRSTGRVASAAAGATVAAVGPSRRRLLERKGSADERTRSFRARRTGLRVSPGRPGAAPGEGDLRRLPV